MQVEKTAIPGVLLITPRRFGDARGFFAETYNAQALATHGVETVFVQDNHSVSEPVGTIRGMHFQAPPHAQDKLVRCGKGALFDVVIDIRKGSPTYGQWVGAELTEENGMQLLAPAGMAHGFITRAPGTEVIYKCSDFYAPQTEGAVRWDDPDVGIDWGFDGAPVLSEKDAIAPLLADLDSPFIWDGNT